MLLAFDITAFWRSTTELEVSGQLHALEYAGMNQGEAITSDAVGNSKHPPPRPHRNQTPVIQPVVLSD
jgi:hypothetical protein